MRALIFLLCQSFLTAETRSRPIPYANGPDAYKAPSALTAFYLAPPPPIFIRGTCGISSRFFHFLQLFASFNGWI